MLPKATTGRGHIGKLAHEGLRGHRSRAARAQSREFITRWTTAPSRCRWPSSSITYDSRRSLIGFYPKGCTRHSARLDRRSRTSELLTLGTRDPEPGGLRGWP